MTENGMEIKNNVNEVSADVAAFKADVELEQYRHRVESGALTEEEQADRKEVLSFLGF